MADETIKRLEDLLAENDEAQMRKAERVAIVGAGTLGQGIAQTIAAAGLDVKVVEKNNEAKELSIKQLSESMDREIARWGMTSSEKKAILSRIYWHTSLDKLNKCDLIIEAVGENLELKKAIFEKLDKIAKPEAIFISTTSTLSLEEIASVTNRKCKFVGMHFLNPVPKVRLVEVVRTIDTAEETMEKIKNFAVSIGKTPVEVYEYPGFITTRVIVPLLNEAMHILLEGLATAHDIDLAMKLGYNLPIGPLELADSMGLDEVLAWMQELWKTLGEPRYRPCPLLRKLVRERKLGKKVGEGFFKYDKNGRIITEKK
jgi:3-hydroxybutyryl-CoA dehydrogenase